MKRFCCSYLKHGAIMLVPVLLFTIFLSFPVFSFAASPEAGLFTLTAEGEASNASSAALRAGEGIEIAALISGNPGLAAWTFTVEWNDKALEYVANSAQPGESFKSGTFLSNAKESGKLRATWYSARNNSSEGMLFSFELKAKEGATSGSYSVKLSCDSENTLNADEKEVSVSTAEYVIALTGEEKKGSSGSKSGQTSGEREEDNAATAASDEAAEESAAEKARERFTDLPADHWAFESVERLSEIGIINGMGDGSFGPENEVTRAQFIKMLAGLACESGMGYETKKFADVSEADWYMPFIAWAVEMGLANGTSETSFSPNVAITREQAATLLYRYSDVISGEAIEESAGEMTEGSAAETTEESVAEVSDERFSDSASISPWAKTAVAWAADSGIIGGFPDGSFKPGASATRAQAAKMIYSMLYAK